MLQCSVHRQTGITNYKVKYIDGSTGPASLPLDNYAFGSTAAYNSWCLLAKDEAAE